MLTLAQALAGISSLPKWLSLNSIPGWLSTNEAVWLYKQALQHNRILEIGCWKGRSTFCLTQGCSGLVVTVDHFQGSRDEDQFWYDNASGGDFKGVRESFLENMREPLTNGRLLLMDMDVEDFYMLCPKIFKHHKFGMIFIDGGHDQQSFAYDLICCKYLLSPGGLLCGHDATHKGVCSTLKYFVPGYTVVPDTTIWVFSPEKPAPAG